MVVAVALLVPAHSAGQTFQGRVLDRMSNAPVATTLVRLISEDGNLQGVSVTLPSGFYSIDASVPGIYRLEGERLGYEKFQTPPQEIHDAKDVHLVDLLLSRSPLLIKSLVVSAERTDEQIRSLIDASPNSLGYRPIQLEAIEGRIVGGRDLGNALRPVSLYGVHLNPEFPMDGLDGPYEHYYQNGQLEAKGTMKDGNRDGGWEEYYENGRLKTKGTYNYGEPDGPYEHYEENGQLETKGTMRDNEVEGRWEEYYESGQLKAKGTMKDGEPDGPYEHYDENGQLQRKGTIEDGDRDGGWEEYYENGQMQTKGTYKDGEVDGRWEEYYENGQLKTKGTYKDG